MPLTNTKMKKEKKVMAKYELKPCPFCGGKARLIYVSQMSAVKCPRCGTLGKVVADYYEQGDGKGEAIEFWNMRADDAKPEE